MFHIRVGPTITEVESEMLETSAALALDTNLSVRKILELLDAQAGAVPHIEFIIGPIREQE